MKNTALFGILAVRVLEAGCMMGPKYKRPTVDVPQEYRAPAPQQAAAASSLGNEGWWQVYQDPVLAQLIHTAIADNYDVRIAAARVLEAQAQVGITRSNQLPREHRGGCFQPAKRQSDKAVSRISGQWRRTESLGDLESRLLGEVSETDRGGSSPITRNRVGAASGDFFAGSQCCNGLFPASCARQRTRNLAAHAGISAR